MRVTKDLHQIPPRIPLRASTGLVCHRLMICTGFPYDSNGVRIGFLLGFPLWVLLRIPLRVPLRIPLTMPLRIP